jgi:4-amino-4-deoxy-L-arabinose transferase-like glycosyltransferase
MMARGAFAPARRLLAVVIGVLLIAAVGRAALLASESVSFHSDEAVIALMARHILQGERPVFFYGQAYMGSLDAWLVAGGFALLGESVLTIRIVQSALWLGFVATGTLAAYALTRHLGAAACAGLLLAVPNTLTALYTTATLGGYNETLLLGALIVLIGAGAIADARAGARPRVWHYAAIGVLSGLGWWTNGLIITAIIPVGLVLLWHIIRGGRARIGASLMPIGTATVCFVIGSAPWWAFNLENDWAALRFYLPGGTPEAFAGGDVPPLPPAERLIGLFLLGLPAVIGLRYPWSPAYLTEPPLMAGLALAALALVIAALVRLARGRTPPHTDGRALLLITLLFFTVLFTLSRFSTDPTGRYFLPLALTLAVMIGAFAAALPRAAAVGVMAIVLAFNTVGLIGAVRENPPGLTTQFNLDTHLPNDDDAALIAWLTERGLTRGYAHYWITFRLAFLSDERLIFRAALPYKRDLGYTPRDDRHPPYVEAVEEARADGEPLAVITGALPEVRAWLEDWLDGQGITYVRDEVGIYAVYHSFTPGLPPLPRQFAPPA